MLPLTIPPTKPRVLSAQLIPSPHPDLLNSLGSARKKGSYGLITCDRNHALFTALDEATKASPVTVLYAKSFYAGNVGTSGPLAGEAMGILHGDDDEIVREGLKATVQMLEDFAFYYMTPSGREIPFYPHVVSSLGTFLSKEAGLKAGEPMAYLIAPPIESIVALDAALKASDTNLIKHFAPPTETNFGGGYLSGSLDACEAAAMAFAQKLIAISEQPMANLSR